MTKKHKIDGNNRNVLADWKFFKLVDAKKDKVLTIEPPDVRKAIPSNFGECVLARNCEKMGYKARFLRNYAYLLKNGIVTRYRISATVKLAVMQFDIKGKWPLFGDRLQVVLKPPSPCFSMEYRRSKEYIIKRKEWNKITRARKKRGLTKTHPKTDGVTMEAWRNGRGHGLSMA
jgi:hypothetical protein